MACLCEGIFLSLYRTILLISIIIIYSFILLFHKLQRKIVTFDILKNLLHFWLAHVYLNILLGLRL